MEREIRSSSLILDFKGGKLRDSGRQEGRCHKGSFFVPPPPPMTRVRYQQPLSRGFVGWITFYVPDKVNLRVFTRMKF